MFDLDEAFHALEGLDAQGRKALVLAGKLWAEIYGDVREHAPAPLTRRHLTQLSERTEEVRELRERLDDALDSREQAEIRAEQAEALLEKARWHSLSGCEPHSPPPWDDERIDQLNAEIQLLRRQLKAARETEYVAIDKMMRERARAEAAEKTCDVLRSEIRALYYRKGRP